MRQIILCMLLVILVGCSKEECTPELCFTISLDEVSDFYATIIVTHTGTNRIWYYVFAVPGEIHDLDAEIQKHLKSVSTNSVSDEMYNQKKRVIRLSELNPETQYTCIAYCLDENNQIVGNPNSLVFKTTVSSIIFSPNPQWKLTYLGQSKYNDKTYSKVNISVTGDISERYFVSIFSKEVVDEYSDVRGILLRAIKDFNSERNELYDDYFWIEDKFVKTGSANYYEYLFKGKYQAFAIGVDANGNLTGHYACSDVFTFDGYDLEPEYADLLGYWEITDDVGSNFDFILSEKWANSTLTMSGFGHNDCPLTLNYSQSGTYFLTIPGQSAMGNAWGEVDSKTMTLRGWYLNGENQFRIYTYEIISTLARTIGKNDDGTFTFMPGFTISLDNDEKASITGVVLTFYDEDKTLHYYNSSKMQFPFTMRKLE